MSAHGRPPDPGYPTRARGTEGIALAEAMIALVVLGLAAAAVTTTTLGATGDGRSAALEGRRAELALRTAEALRTGRIAGDSGAVAARSGGEDFEVRWIRRDDVAPGAIEVEVRSAGGGSSLRFGPARPAP